MEGTETQRVHARPVSAAHCQNMDLFPVVVFDGNDFSIALSSETLFECRNCLLLSDADPVLVPGDRFPLRFKKPLPHISTEAAIIDVGKAIGGSHSESLVNGKKVKVIEIKTEKGAEPRHYISCVCENRQFLIDPSGLMFNQNQF